VVANAIKNQIVMLIVRGEIMPRVIDDSSAPIDRTISRFLVLHTPVTCAPNDLAICTAKVPTPPAAPLTRTLLPPESFLIAQALQRGESGDVYEAACSKVTLSGSSQSFLACAGILSNGRRA